jgi:hypothetical protein
MTPELRQLKQEVFRAFFGPPPPGPLAERFRTAREILKRAPNGPAKRELQAYLNHVVAVFRGGTEAPR